MEKYALQILIQGEIEAFDFSDVKEAIANIFGDGLMCDLEITGYEIVNAEQLN